jgi:hypothetical protein
VSWSEDRDEFFDEMSERLKHQIERSTGNVSRSVSLTPSTEEAANNEGTMAANLVTMPTSDDLFDDPNEVKYKSHHWGTGILSQIPVFQ